MAWKRSGVRIPLAPRKMSKSKFALPDGGANLFCGDLRQSLGAGIGEDAGCGLIGGVGGVLFVVEGDADGRIGQAAVNV